MFKPEDITACLFDAVDEFSTTQKQSRLRELRFVIFHKQKFMMDPVIRSLHKKTQNAVTAQQQKSSSMISKLKGGTLILSFSLSSVAVLLGSFSYEKTCLRVCDQGRLQPACAATEVR